MKTSIASHANNLSPLIKASGKSYVTIFADGGADFNVNHITNEWYYMKIFKNLNLDVLLATTHCPGFSARNPIEHVWSVLTKASVSIYMYLPDHLPNEQPPAKQRLNPEEKLVKENQVFDAALKKLDLYWDDLQYDGLKINVTHRSSLHQPTPHTMYE